MQYFSSVARETEQASTAARPLPEPAVSVPSAKLHSPPATATAEPHDEPPGVKRLSKALAGTHSYEEEQSCWCEQKRAT